MAQWIRVDGSSATARRPDTSVRNTSFSASRAAASAPAAVSALMLKAWPDWSVPMVATTGISPWASSWWTITGSTCDDVAHVAERLGPGRGRDQVGVLTGQPDGQGPVHVDRADDVAVDFADQDHPHQVDGVGVGDPEAVLELDLLAHPRHQRTDLGPASVDDHREHAHRPHQHDVLGEGGQRLRLVDGRLPRLGGEHVAAVLDHHHLVPEPADVGKRLHQHGGLVPGEEGRPGLA